MSYYNRHIGIIKNGLHPYTIAYLSAMATPLDRKYHIIVDRLVSSLVVNNIWTEMDAIYLMTMTTSAQGRLNLVSPTGADALLNVVGTVTHTTNSGFNCTGNNSNRLSMNTACGSLPNFRQNDASFGAWTINTASENAFVCGETSGNNQLCPNLSGGNQYGRINMSSNSSTSAGGGGNGFHVMNRSGASAFQMYFNGSSFSTGTTASASGGLGNVFNFVNANSGIPQTTARLRVGFIGGSLDATQHSNLYTALNTFLSQYDAA